MPVYSSQPSRKLGAVAQLSGKSLAGGPVTIRLIKSATSSQSNPAKSSILATS